MKYCSCDNSFIKNGKCTTCGLPYDFTLSEDEMDLKCQIMKILNITEEEFNTTPAKELFERLKQKGIPVYKCKKCGLTNGI